MAIFSNDTGAGIAASLLGLIVLVFTGIGLSMLVEKRIRASGSAGAITLRLDDGRSHIGHLRGQRDRLRDRLDRLGPSLTMLAEELAALPDPDTLASRVDLAKSELDSLRRKTADTEARFAEYRKDYRRHAWNSAIGQSLGNLTIHGGRTYRDAVIRKVTADGIDIRHESGSARIAIRDLDSQLRDRLQFEEQTVTAWLSPAAVETPAKPDPEVRVTAIAPSSREEKPAHPAGKRKHPSPEAGELPGKARAAVVHWKSVVRHLGSAHATAVANIGNPSGRRSPPGSLETWESRASRLGSELARARAKLAAARAELAQIAPNDPLVRPTPGERD